MGMVLQLRLLSDKERLDWLRLSRSENVGTRTFFDLLKLYGSASRALESVQEMSVKGGRKQPITLCSQSDAEREITRHIQLGASLVAACEPEFSPLLREIKDCPPMLSMRGHKALLKRSSIAIVGARNASANGCHFAQKLAADLGEAGIVCISGLARGIDTAVHHGSLKTGTVGVIAGGIDNIYPKENAGLYKAMAEQGLIIAESPFGAQPKSQSFPRRNRIISGLSSGTVVVEASQGSGSLITARMAADQGRDVFAVPGSPLDPRCKGTNDLIRQGAILTENASDVLHHIHFAKHIASSGLLETASPGFDSLHRVYDEGEIQSLRPKIVEKLGMTPVSVDEIISQLGIPPQIVLTVIIELELAGKLERTSGNRVSLLSAGETEMLFALT